MDYWFSDAISLRKPRVGNHVFTPITYSKLPLTNTYFSTFTGIGSTSGLVSGLGDLPFRGLSGEVPFIDLGFAYQQRVCDWLAAYVELNISARVGTELQSILTQTFSTITSFNIGWHIRLSEGEKYRLSGVIGLQNNKCSFVNLLGFGASGSLAYGETYTRGQNGFSFDGGAGGL